MTRHDMNISLGFSLAALAAGTMISACSASDAPTKPASGNAAASLGIVVNGNDPRGFVGEPLTNPVSVQVVDASLQSVAGRRRIRFSVALGGGSISDTIVLSSETGFAAVTWQLGATVGVQQLAVSVADAPSSGEKRISVQALARDAGDRIVISGATSGTIGVLVRKDAGVTPYTLVWPDTVLTLLPRVSQGGWEEVTAFTVGHPPVSVLRPWTDGVDTVRLAFRPPIAVPFAIWVTYDSDTSAARARHDLSVLDTFWRTQMTGLRVGNVRIESAPALMFVCGEDTRGYIDRSAINVYYLNYRDGPVACDASIIRMHANNPFSFADQYQFILAHEVGHAMSLAHFFNSGNVMWPQSPMGGELTTGQIYWMHFDSWGALNAVLGIHPAAERHCEWPAGVYCPAQTFTAW